MSSTEEEGLRLIRAFRKIGDAERRAEIIALVEKDAAESESDNAPETAREPN
jgi:hypothetical protein